jgi:hypothetical protein
MRSQGLTLEVVDTSLPRGLHILRSSFDWSPVPIVRLVGPEPHLGHVVLCRRVVASSLPVDHVQPIGSGP